MSDTDVVKEIQALFPEGKKVTLKGKEYAIKPFGFGQFPKVLNLIKGFKDPKGASLTVSNLGDLLADNADAVIDFACLATKEPKAFFEDVPMDEAIYLMQAILEVNSSFFMQRLQPTILKAIEELTKSLGAVSSPS